MVDPAPPITGGCGGRRSVSQPELTDLDDAVLGQPDLDRRRAVRRHIGEADRGRLPELELDVVGEGVVKDLRPEIRLHRVDQLAVDDQVEGGGFHRTVVDLQQC